MNNTIPVSIIIPVYNVSTDIERCIRSVMDQTYQGALECILVDDGSADDGIEKAERLIGESDSSVSFRILRHERNRGTSAARNTGMDKATGDYIFFLDGDDVLTPDCIYELVRVLEEERYDMVIGNVKTIGSDMYDKLLSLKMEDGSVLRQPQILKTYRRKWNMTPTNKLYRMGFIRDSHLRFKDGIWYEDELWSLESACLLQSMRVVRKDTYLYYRNDYSTTAQQVGKKVKYSSSYVDILEELRHFMSERQLFNATLYFFIQWFFLNKYLFCFLEDRRAYADRYREVVSLARFGWWKRMRANGLSLKYHIRDLHYLLPASIAPYWQRTLFKFLKKQHGAEG